LQFELWIGDAAEIRTKRVRQQKTDRQDAQLILRLLLEDRFRQIWVPSWENRDLQQLLWHRHRLVQARTRIMNQQQAVALEFEIVAGPSPGRRLSRDMPDFVVGLLEDAVVINGGVLITALIATGRKFATNGSFIFGLIVRSRSVLESSARRESNLGLWGSSPCGLFSTAAALSNFRDQLQHPNARGGC
jgi:hypothetical protein